MDRPTWITLGAVALFIGFAAGMYLATVVTDHCAR